MKNKKNKNTNLANENDNTEMMFSTMSSGDCTGLIPRGSDLDDETVENYEHMYEYLTKPIVNNPESKKDK